MLRNIITAVFVIICLFIAAPAHCADGSKLISKTGALLKGTVYKQSGVERTGYITIRTTWNLPGIPPVFRYDFDLMSCKIDANLYTYLMGDIADMEFLPLLEGAQAINMRLRNGMGQLVVLSSDDKALLGTVKLRLKEVVVITDKYGENVIPADDVAKITFSAPVPPEHQSMSGLVDELDKALQTGKRDDLVDDSLQIILENIQKKMAGKLKEAPDAP